MDGVHSLAGASAGGRASNRRPHRLTIRELLLLVASGTGATDQRAYLNQIFDWYFNRTRDLLVAIVAAALGAPIALVGRAPPSWVVALVVVLEVALVVSYFWARQSLKPLHREYLCCLVLMHRLSRFRAPLFAALDDGGGPPGPGPGTYLPWHGSLLGAGEHVAMRVRRQDAVSRRRTLGDSPTPAMLGHYLFDVLAPVPTDEYERRAPVRLAVDDVIHRVARLQRP
jgi:hypothetical protein